MQRMAAFDGPAAEAEHIANIRCSLYPTPVTTKSPDVLCAPPSDLTALTLAEMLVRGWRLRGRCTETRRCRLVVRVNLTSLVRVYGPNQVWWGARTACPREDCRGRIVYAAQSIAGGTWVSLDRAPCEAALRRRERASHRGEPQIERAPEPRREV